MKYHLAIILTILSLVFSPSAFAASQTANLKLVDSLTDAKGELTAGAATRVSDVITVADRTPEAIRYRGDGENLVIDINREDLTTWQPTQATISGTDGIVASAVNIEHRIVENSGKSIAIGATLVYSVKIKAGAVSWVQLYYLDGTGLNMGYFNLGAGVVGNTQDLITSSISAIDDDGFYRCSITFTQNNNTLSHMRIIPAISDGSTIFLGDGSTVSTYAKEVQLEEIAYPNVLMDETDAGDNFRISLVDGQSWFGANNAGGAPDVADRKDTGNLAKVCDSTPNCAWGYLGEEGLGEALGSEIITAQVDRDFSGASGWANTDINAYDETGDLTLTANAASQYCTLPDANAVRVIDKEYKLQYDVANLVDNWTISDEDADFTITGTVTDASTNTIYFTEVDSANIGGFRITSNGNTSSADFDNFTLKEVTEPPAYCTKIYKESSLINEGWLLIEPNFDPNDITTFDIMNVNLDELEPRTYSGTATDAIPAEAPFDDHGLFGGCADTNQLLYGQDGTNAIWTKTDITPLLDVTDLEGDASSATRLTSSGANGTIKQSLSGTPDGTFVVWLKRISGAGNIFITDDDFATDQAVTLTTDWTKHIFAAACGLNPVAGIKIATSGDVIAMDMAMVRKWPESSDVIPTTSTPVAITDQATAHTEGSNLLNILSTAEGDASSQGTLAFTWYPYYAEAAGSGTVGIVSVNDTTTSILHTTHGSTLISDDETNTPNRALAWAANTEYKVFVRWDHDIDAAGDFQVSILPTGGSLAHSAVTAYDGAFDLTGGELIIGQGNSFPSSITAMQFWDKWMTDNWLEHNYGTEGGGSMDMGMGMGM